MVVFVDQFLQFHDFGTHSFLYMLVLWFAF